jgi:hypothetical protein
MMNLATRGQDAMKENMVAEVRTTPKSAATPPKRNCRRVATRGASKEAGDRLKEIDRDTAWVRSSPAGETWERRADQMVF